MCSHQLASIRVLITENAGPRKDHRRRRSRHSGLWQRPRSRGSAAPATRRQGCASIATVIVTIIHSPVVMATTTMCNCITRPSAAEVVVRRRLSTEIVGEKVGGAGAEILTRVIVKGYLNGLGVAQLHLLNPLDFGQLFELLTIKSLGL